MRILNVICSTDPRQGGVIEWVRQFAPIAASLGHTVEVASMDNPDDDWVKNFPVKVHAFGHRLRYFSSPQLGGWLKSNTDRYDLYIAHGLWRYPSIATHRALRNTDPPYFVYTHGMLDPWFKKQYPLKHLLKWIYWILVEYRVLKNAKGVIFTCEQERNKAKLSFRPYNAHELVSTIGIAGPSGDKQSRISAFHNRFPETRNRNVMLFLGRIHPKKGCDMLIEAFARAITGHSDLHLVFAGPGDENYLSGLKRSADKLGITHRITWTGMIGDDIKWGAFDAADCFILPSHQENFGISVVEALACSLPVLISDKVDIYREIQQDQAGIISEDTFEGTCDLINHWHSLNKEVINNMRANALACFKNRFEISNATAKLLELLGKNIS